MSLTMKSQWQRFESWIAKNAPEVIADLNEGCIVEQFTKVENEIGLNLPQSFKDFYLIHNGQKSEGYLDGIPGLFYNVTLLTLERIVRHWQLWCEIIDDCGEYGLEELDDAQTSLMPDKLKAQYANKKWIPFAVFSDSNYLGLDYDPEINGRFGQVINFGREEEQKTVLADSFEEFVDWYINELERGNFLIVEKVYGKDLIPKELESRFLGNGTYFCGYVANRFISLSEELKYIEEVKHL